MEDIVLPNQWSFVPGCQIMENIVICQEMIHTFGRKRRKGGLTIKVDLEKCMTD